MRDKLLELTALLEQLSVTGERNAVIYVTCLRELRALANGEEGNHGDVHAEP